MAEPRSAVMIVADAWWEGPDGISQRGPVRIVNKSISGACVRVKSRIDVGARLRIQCPRQSKQVTQRQAVQKCTLSGDQCTFSEHGS